MQNHLQPTIFFKNQACSMTIRYLEFILCGHKQRKIIEKFYPKIKNKIIITGDIKYDLPEKSIVIFKASIKNNQKYKKNLFCFLKFFFSTWKYINKDKLDYDGKCRDILSTIKLSIKNGKRRISRNKHEYKYLFSYIEAIKLIANTFKNLDIIVRPHPADHPDFWNSQFNQKNIFVEYIYDIKAWIKVSELSISYACSSVIENFFLKKNSFFYFSDFKKKYDKKFYYNICINSKSKKELINHIKKLLIKKIYNKNLIKILFIMIKTYL